MADIEFTELSPASNITARVETFIGTTAYDIVSDPMTVNITAEGVDVDGVPVSTPVVRSYAKADWSGAVV